VHDGLPIFSGRVFGLSEVLGKACGGTARLTGRERKEEKARI